jgi:hypothetical protein
MAVLMQELQISVLLQAPASLYDTDGSSMYPIMQNISFVAPLNQKLLIFQALNSEKIS